MEQRKDQGLEQRALDLVDRHWKWLVVLVWVGFSAWFIYSKWADIRLFNLGDTDDNMRMMQVRGLLGGQEQRLFEGHLLALGVLCAHRRLLPRQGLVSLPWSPRPREM